MASLIAQLVPFFKKYHLLEHGKPVLLAISGGIDSLSMAKTLTEYRHAVDPDLSLRAIYIRIPEVTLNNKDIRQMSDFFTSLKVPLEVLHGEVSADQDFRCYTCAKEHRKQLCLYAANNGYQTIAFGHNLDDYLEIGFMNLVYGGHLESLQPCQPMFKEKVTVIRPLLPVSKKHIVAYAKSQNLPKIQANCKYELNNRRESIRRIMIELRRLNRAFIPNLRQAINRWNGLQI